MQGSKWQPKQGVTRHSGNPITSEMDFFASPSPEIGTITLFCHFPRIKL
ncbi:hypothetical protein H1P_1020013 [Hyella patelloides LEGE 07179]|uniref:Uncharacterized protein n=1 Tax=Hyella patelloides LEGE 07179 TaxID=945734 RepID=A0A563VIY0_9CYAN|nr:hypothetical protein [Hyella patelloides]VEP11390.1 hypothetical protein H1P_1020013 [Hyella patelloides LEGE 07179]